MVTRVTLMLPPHREVHARSGGEVTDDLVLDGLVIGLLAGRNGLVGRADHSGPHGLGHEQAPEGSKGGGPHACMGGDQRSEHTWG